MSTATITQERRYVTFEEREQRALERARSLGHYARKVSDTHFRVYSEQPGGGQYDVLLTCSGPKCNCKAGQWGKPCKHAARVALRLQRERFGPKASIEPDATSVDEDIEQDLSDIADYLREEGGGIIRPFDPIYSDGTPKPYNATDGHRAMVRKAQASWSFDDGEAA
jgi:hypothetical protein